MRAHGKGEKRSAVSNESTPLSAREMERRAAAATLIQKMWRGREVRKHYRVKSVEGAPGIVHTRVQGTAEHFARVGFEMETRVMGIGSRNPGSPHEQTLDILSIDKNQYRGGVAGGKALGYSKDTATSVADKTGKPTAFINASYFNYGDARQKHLPDYTPIGETRSEGETLVSSAVPKPYRNDYVSLKFVDSGDVVTAGPRLAGPKKGVFGIGAKPLEQTFKASNKAKYKYRDEQDNTYPTAAIPGYLHHAGDPNARSAISWPKADAAGGGPAGVNTTSRQDRIRMMTVKSNTGRGGGLSMPELSAAATRLTSWNNTPGGALNLDGGGSSSMGVVRPGGRLLVSGGYNERSRFEGPREVSTIITYGHKG